jgi:hypothetical protein
MKLVPIYEVEDFEKRLSSSTPTYVNPDHVLKVSTEPSRPYKVTVRTRKEVAVAIIKNMSYF